MSFTSDYLKHRKLRQKEQQESEKNDFISEYEKLPYNGVPVTVEKLPYNGDNGELAKLGNFISAYKEATYNRIDKGENDDIAPIVTTQKEEKKESGWFKAPDAFDDGYQFGDVMKSILATGSNLTESISAGVLGIGEKVVDAGAYIVGGVGGLLGADDFKQDVGDFIAKDLYDERELAKKINVFQRAYGGGAGQAIINKILDIDTEEDSLLGDKTASRAQSGGELLGTMGLQAVGVPWYLTTGVTSFGGATEGALNEGATFEEAGLYGAISAGAEILTEKLFGGSGLGEKGLINLDALTKGISSKAVKALADIGVDMAAEGTEEVVSSFIGRLGSSLYKEENLDEILFSEEAVDEYIDSFIGGAALGGVMNTGKAASSIKTGRDYRSGLTENEQKVFDRVYNERLTEAENDGKKLSKKDEGDGSLSHSHPGQSHECD